ncbi:spore germination protein [Feifania hominis]|uniref:Spore germination protein n=1 Tax=Feifania hominis TaxID=2763660 RepID=A0A926DAH3_9FIRM|nr:spore germination protein [Feifania hominis]MBC8535405.1 spore germination protein [Feifania hominis]
MKQNIDGMNPKDIKIPKKLDDAIDIIHSLFQNDQTIRYRFVQNRHNPNVRFCLVVVDAMVNSRIINENIIRPLAESEILTPGAGLFDAVYTQTLTTIELAEAENFGDALPSLLMGDTLLFIDGCPRCVGIDTKGYSARSVSEPPGEEILKGPREGFTETILPNCSLIRRKIQTHHLKFEFSRCGKSTETQVCLCYIDNIADPKLVERMRRKIDEYDLGSMLDSNYLAEVSHLGALSPFKTVATTERPDVVAAKLLEGRVAVLVDGTPVVITAPTLFIELFQTSEDYYVNYIYASFSRLLRLVGFFLCITVPALYVSMVTFSQEMLPTKLIVSISNARQGVPFPTVLEAFALLIIFDILKETGLRGTTGIGSALGIVGSLVLGQAAVEAKFISAPIVIVIAFSGVTSILVPKLSGAILFCKYTILTATALLGIYGFSLALLAIFLHLFSLESFGVPYLAYSSVSAHRTLKDSPVRSPWTVMRRRPFFASRSNQIRKGRRHE